MKPLLIYDGDCRFCRRWIERWKKKLADCVEFEPYQTAAARFPDVPGRHFRESVQFVDETGRRYAGAEAAYRLFDRAPGGSRLFWFYRHLPGFRALSEWGYRLVAGNRSFFSRFF